MSIPPPTGPPLENPHPLIILGVLLILVGAVLIIPVVFTSGTAETVLGISSLSLMGAGVGLAIWGRVLHDRRQS